MEIDVQKLGGVIGAFLLECVAGLCAGNVIYDQVKKRATPGSPLRRLIVGW
jgi:hypothetical protein